LINQCRTRRSPSLSTPSDILSLPYSTINRLSKAALEPSSFFRHFHDVGHDGAVEDDLGDVAASPEGYSQQEGLEEDGLPLDLVLAVAHGLLHMRKLHSQLIFNPKYAIVIGSLCYPIQIIKSSD
jgi:hypothetical protein